MMISRNLEIFIQVAKSGNITKTAKTMYISQPAISNAIAKLESDLNVKLFFRDKRKGLVLTNVGKKILSLAKQMESIDEHIKQVAYKENHLIEGRLKIAILTSLVATILSKVIKEFRQLYPGVIIEIIEGSPNDIYQMVENYHVDFAISVSPFSHFDAITLLEDHIIATLPASSNSLSSLDLQTPPDLLVINKPAYETVLDHLSDKNYLDPDHLMIVQTAQSALHMVKDGIGIGIISEYTLDTLANDFQKIPVKPKIKFEIGLFANDLNDLTPIASEFVDMVKEIYGIK